LGPLDESVVHVVRVLGAGVGLFRSEAAPALLRKRRRDDPGQLTDLAFAVTR
jgi:hypothetical protein